jgi:hypothetical protein
MDEEKQSLMLKLFGEYRSESAGSLEIETRRITDNIDLFESILREAFPDITMVVGGHHIMFMQRGSPLPGEIASADTLIFDHGIARKIWGPRYLEFLAKFAALEPLARDACLRRIYFEPKDQRWRGMSGT